MRIHPRLILAALRTLEDALAQAEFSAVAPEWGHELALRVIEAAPIGERWQFDRFRDTMQDEFVGAHSADQAVYLRTAYLTSLIDCWWRAIGRQPPCPVRRARWVNAYAAELDASSGTRQHPCVCNRYQPGDRQLVTRLFQAEPARAFNDGPSTVHPKDPALVVVRRGGNLVLEQMTWGFPVQLRGKRGDLLKPKPVNNARFDKLNGYWKRWAMDPAHRCLIPTTRYAEAVGPRGKMTETWLSLKDEPIFAWAGLWRDSDGWGLAYTGVMTNAPPEHAHIHDRAPVILDRDQWSTWLTAPIEQLAVFDKTLPADRLQIDATDKLWAAR